MRNGSSDVVRQNRIIGEKTVTILRCTSIEMLVILGAMEMFTATTAGSALILMTNVFFMVSFLKVSVKLPSEYFLLLISK